MVCVNELWSYHQPNSNDRNLVFYESSLPHGQGLSPIIWQILEEANDIKVTQFEVTAELEACPIYLQQQIALQSHELVKRVAFSAS